MTGNNADNVTDGIHPPYAEESPEERREKAEKAMEEMMEEIGIEAIDDLKEASALSPTLIIPTVGISAQALSNPYVLGIGFLILLQGDTPKADLIKRGSSAESEYSKKGKEHTVGARESTRGIHEKGQSRKQRDQGKEKGDARRTRYK